MVSYSAISEGLELHSEIQNVTISDGTLNASFDYISWLNGSFFNGDDRGILKEEVKPNLMAQSSPLNSTLSFSSAHQWLWSMLMDRVEIHPVTSVCFISRKYFDSVSIVHASFHP